MGGLLHKFKNTLLKLHPENHTDGGEATRS